MIGFIRSSEGENGALAKLKIIMEVGTMFWVTLAILVLEVVVGDEEKKFRLCNCPFDCLEESGLAFHKIKLTGNYHN